MNFSRRRALLSHPRREIAGPAVERRAATHLAVARGWGTAALLIGLAALAFGLVFAKDVTDAVSVWIASTAYNHCFLIVPLIGYLLWERRSVFGAVSPAPVFWPLAVVPLLTAVWLLAAVLDLKEGRQFAVVAMFEIVLLATLGPRLVRLLLAPLLFLFFLVPSGAFLVPTLQQITAHIVVHGLHLLNIPVYSDGFMIEIPEGRFEIAEACAGLRFLIASIVFGCFFAVTMYRSYFRRALFIALSLAVPIGANGLRALGIIVLAHLEGSATAVEADHILYGWIFFSLVILLLIAIGMAFSDDREHRALFRPAMGLPVPRWRLAAAAVAAVLLAALGPAYAARLDAMFAASPLPKFAAPQIAAPWREVPESRVGWRPVVHDADRELLQSFVAPGTGIVVRYLALYRLRAVGNALTNSQNRMADDRTWEVASQGRSEIVLGGRNVVVGTTQIVSGPRRRLVWSFYLVDGNATAGMIEAKLLQARAALLRRASVAALVAVSASEEDPQHPAPAQLERFLKANEPLLRYLKKLSLTHVASGGNPGGG